MKYKTNMAIIQWYTHLTSKTALFFIFYHTLPALIPTGIASKKKTKRFLKNNNFYLFSFLLFSAHRYMRTIPNAFIANMSLADLMLASLNCSFNFVTMRDRKWVFGSTYCTFNNFMAIVTVAASVLNLTAMSLDRWIMKQQTEFSNWKKN